jgi:hypothetical protein
MAVNPVVSVTLAALICGRSPETIRKAIRDGDLPILGVRPHGGKKGEPGEACQIHTGELHTWHLERSGDVWHSELIPGALAEAVNRLHSDIETLHWRIRKLEEQHAKKHPNRKHAAKKHAKA